MARRSLALLFAHAAPAVIGASIPSWLFRFGAVSSEGEAGDSISIRPSLLLPTDVFVHMNDSIEQKVHACNEVCAADDVDCGEHDCFEYIDAGAVGDTRSNASSAVHSSYEDDYVHCSWNG